MRHPHDTVDACGVPLFGRLWEHGAVRIVNVFRPGDSSTIEGRAARTGPA
jgi:hypothetical protein